MTDTTEVAAIRAAMRLFESASNTAEIEAALDAFELASGPGEVSRLVKHIDAQQAEIARLKAENAKLLSDVTRPESLDVGLMRAEIERLSKDAARYQWLRDGGIYILPYDDHGAGPEFDLSDASVDAGMKETS